MGILILFFSALLFASLLLVKLFKARADGRTDTRRKDYIGMTALDGRKEMGICGRI